MVMINKPLISILTPSINENNILLEHIDWFESLECLDLELVIVDQSDCVSQDIMLKCEVISNLKYIHSEVKGLSFNRNLGAEYAQGKYILFLDDNACFNVGSLDNILTSVREGNYDIVLCSITDDKGVQTSYTPSTKESLVNVLNIEGKVNSNGVLARSELVRKIKFDDEMGVGSVFGSCEEIDFVIRSILYGSSVFYCPKNKVIHPPQKYNSNKAFNYGKGHGYLTYKLFFTYGSLSCKLLAAKKILKMTVKFLLSFCFWIEDSKNYKSWVRGFILGFFNR